MGSCSEQQFFSRRVRQANVTVPVQYQNAGAHALDNLLVDLLQLRNAPGPAAGQCFAADHSLGDTLQNHRRGEIQDAQRAGPNDVVGTFVDGDHRPAGDAQRADGRQCGVEGAHAGGGQDVAGGHGHNHQVGQPVGNAGTGQQQAVHHQDICEYRQGDMPLPGLEAGQQKKGDKAVQGQVRNHPGLVVIQPAETGVCGERVYKQQGNQQQADDHPVVVVDPEQARLLVFCRWPERRAGMGCVGKLGCHEGVIVSARKKSLPLRGYNSLFMATSYRSLCMATPGTASADSDSPRKLRVVMAQLDFLVGDIPGNTELVLKATQQAQEQHQADIVLFPELCLTGYPPEDLLLRPSLDLRIAEALERLQQANLEPAMVIGAPVRSGGLLYNAAVVVEKGEIRGRYFKRCPPNYQVFDEKRYFAEGRDTLVMEFKGVPVGITVCEDIWKDGPLEDAAAAGAQLILNLNASPYDIDKQARRKALLERKAADNRVSIVYTNLVGGQDELVFDGGSMVVDHAGALAVEAPQFADGLFPVEFLCEHHCQPISQPLPEEPSLEANVYNALVTGVRDYVNKNGFKSVVLGLSGGIDSAVTLAVDHAGALAVEAPQFADGLFPVEFLCEHHCQPISQPLPEEPSLEANVYNALVTGVRDYVNKNGFKSVVLGLSGGIDSAVTLAVAADALGKDRVRAVMMPFRYTSSASLEDAEAQASAMGVQYDVFSIE